MPLWFKDPFTLKAKTRSKIEERHTQEVIKPREPGVRWSTPFDAALAYTDALFKEPVSARTRTDTAWCLTQVPRGLLQLIADAGVQIRFIHPDQNARTQTLDFYQTADPSVKEALAANGRKAFYTPYELTIHIRELDPEALALALAHAVDHTMMRRWARIDEQIYPALPTRAEGGDEASPQALLQGRSPAHYYMSEFAASYAGQLIENQFDRILSALKVGPENIQAAWALVSGSGKTRESIQARLAEARPMHFFAEVLLNVCNADWYVRAQPEWASVVAPQFSAAVEHLIKQCDRALKMHAAHEQAYRLAVQLASAAKGTRTVKTEDWARHVRQSLRPVEQRSPVSPAKLPPNVSPLSLQRTVKAVTEAALRCPLPPTPEHVLRLPILHPELVKLLQPRYHRKGLVIKYSGIVIGRSASGTEIFVQRTADAVAFFSWHAPDTVTIGQSVQLHEHIGEPLTVKPYLARSKEQPDDVTPLVPNVRIEEENIPHAKDCAGTFNSIVLARTEDCSALVVYCGKQTMIVDNIAGVRGGELLKIESNGRDSVQVLTTAQQAERATAYLKQFEHAL